MISLFRSARATKRRMPSFRAPSPSRQRLNRSVAKRRCGSPAVVGMTTTIMSAFVVSRIDWVSRSSFVRSAADRLPVSSTTWALGRPSRTTAGTCADAEGAEMTATRTTAIAATRRMTRLTDGATRRQRGQPPLTDIIVPSTRAPATPPAALPRGNALPRGQGFAGKSKSPVRSRHTQWMWLAGFPSASGWTLQNSITNDGPSTR